MVLASRPSGYPVEGNFRVESSSVPEVGQGELLLRNAYVSLDAGFRNWMNEGSGDEVLPAMAVGAPVMGLTLGEVIESRNAEYREGDWLMARLAWEEYSLSDGSDYSSCFTTPRRSSPRTGRSFSTARVPAIRRSGARSNHSSFMTDPRTPRSRKLYAKWPGRSPPSHPRGTARD